MVRKQKSEQGFTIIELLVVIAIIGLIAAVAAVGMTTAREDARNKKRLADVSQMQTAIEAVIQQRGIAPDPGNDWAEFQQSIGASLIQLPTDPTNSNTLTYVYCRNKDDRTRYAVMAQLENETSIDGDIDGDINYGFFGGVNECVASSPTLPGDNIQFNLVSDECGVLGGNDSRFCLGFKRD